VVTVDIDKGGEIGKPSSEMKGVVVEEIRAENN